jgi:anti-sigma factor RsiW
MKQTPKAPFASIERAVRAIRALYDPVLHEPVPQRLRALVRRFGASRAGDETDTGKADPPRRPKRD